MFSCGKRLKIVAPSGFSGRPAAAFADRADAISVALGTLVTSEELGRPRSPSYPTKKNVRLRTIGPPRVPPKLLFLNGPFLAPGRVSKKFLAFNLSWRKNS